MASIRGFKQMIIEKDTISRNFSSAASTYDMWAEPQRKMARKLVELSQTNEGDINVLDLGCGTGNIVEEVLKRNPSATVLGVDIAPGMIDYCRNQWRESTNIKFCHGDIHNFIPSEKYDLILSGCTFQWIEDSSNIINRLSRCLNDAGTLGIAVLIDGAFCELRETYKSLLNRDLPGPKYRTKEYYVEAIQDLNLGIKIAKSETIKCYFNGLDILRYFKNIGATFKHNKNYSPLTIKDTNRLIKHYENKYGLANGLLPITHKVLYLVSTKQQKM